MTLLQHELHHFIKHAHAHQQPCQCWGNTGIIFANGEAQATNRRLSNPAFFRADILEWTHTIILDLAE